MCTMSPYQTGKMRPGRESNRDAPHGFHFSQVVILHQTTWNVQANISKMTADAQEKEDIERTVRDLGRGAWARGG